MRTLPNPGKRRRVGRKVWRLGGRVRLCPVDPRPGGQSAACPEEATFATQSGAQKGAHETGAAGGCPAQVPRPRPRARGPEALGSRGRASLSPDPGLLPQGYREDAGVRAGRRVPGHRAGEQARWREKSRLPRGAGVREHVADGEGESAPRAFRALGHAGAQKAAGPRAWLEGARGGLGARRGGAPQSRPLRELRASAAPWRPATWS